MKIGMIFAKDWHREYIEVIRKTLKEELICYEDVSVTEHTVSGCGELAWRVNQLDSHYDAFVCIAIVKKGQTNHDLFVGTAAMVNLGELERALGKPIARVIIPIDTYEQAHDRVVDEKSPYYALGKVVSILMDKLKPDENPFGYLYDV